MSRCWIGSSGWNYRHWRPEFYPAGVAQREWLTYYADRFDTVEVNSLFYGLPKPDTVARWAESVPNDFRFAVKVSRYMTHVKRLLEPAAGWERLFAVCEPFGAKLGVFLVQLPPRFQPDAGRLDRFLAAAPRKVPVAVEFRDARWFIDEIEAVLRTHAAALVGSDFAGLDTPEWVTAPFNYLRRHGTAARYAGEYGPSRLRELAEMLVGFEGDAYCYFNNDAAAAATRDAKLLADLIGRRDSPAS